MRTSPATSPLTAMYERWTRPSYEARVRGKGPWPGGVLGVNNYLWGSAGFKPIAFDKPLILHIRNDLFGEAVTIYTTASATAIGTLQPGECVSIQVQNISGVYATCADGLESVVGCIIKDSA